MKWVGSFLVLFSSVFCSLRYLRDKRLQIRDLNELCDGIALMAGELELHCAPLPDLMAFCAGRTRHNCRKFFSCLSNGDALLGKKSFSELWENAASLCFASLSGAELDEIKRLGTILGRTELSKQVSMLETCRGALLDKLRREESAYIENRKLSLGLSTALGALLIVVLL